VLKFTKIFLKIINKQDKNMKLRLTEEIWKEGNMYVSYCPELDISSCGDTIEKAKSNLTETIQINVEETKKNGTFDKFLKEYGFTQSFEGSFVIRKELIGFEPIEVFV
jgi:predicted RNase H-like HicB family nuclease